MAEPSKTPPPKDVMTAEMKRQIEDARQEDASKKAYDKVSPLGRGIPSIPVEKKATGGKVQKVMQEFKSGLLKSSSGQKVTDPKQAIAIGLSEQRRMKGGGSVDESKKMMGKEVAFMEKKGAPASMMKHEKKEMGMKKSGMMKYAGGGKLPMVESDGKMVPKYAVDGVGKMNMGGMAGMKKMNMGGMAKYAKGGGIESHGKTKGTMIRMATGGSVSARADGIAQRGKTKFKSL